MEREEGFYWIESDPAPVIAQWEQGVWWLPGKEQEFFDAVVLSERINPPTT